MRAWGTKDRRQDGDVRWDGAGGLVLRALALIVFLLASVISFAATTSAVTLASQVGELRKEIVDPCLGARWQLIVDPSHPGWPGRLILAAMDEGVRSSHAARGTAGLESTIAIHVGDQVSVDQSSPVIHAQFQAIALQSAAVGKVLRVRLMAGKNMPLNTQGVVVSVLATGVKQTRWLAPEGIAR